MTQCMILLGSVLALTTFRVQAFDKCDGNYCPNNGVFLPDEEIPDPDNETLTTTCAAAFPPDFDTSPIPSPCFFLQGLVALEGCCTDIVDPILDPCAACPGGDADFLPNETPPLLGGTTTCRDNFPQSLFDTGIGCTLLAQVVEQTGCCTTSPACLGEGVDLSTCVVQERCDETCDVSDLPLPELPTLPPTFNDDTPTLPPIELCYEARWEDALVFNQCCPACADENNAQTECQCRPQPPTPQPTAPPPPPSTPTAPPPSPPPPPSTPTTPSSPAPTPTTPTNPTPTDPSVPTTTSSPTASPSLPPASTGNADPLLEDDEDDDDDMMMIILIVVILAVVLVAAVLCYCCMKSGEGNASRKENYAGGTSTAPKLPSNTDSHSRSTDWRENVGHSQPSGSRAAPPPPLTGSQNRGSAAPPGVYGGADVTSSSFLVNSSASATARPHRGDGSPPKGPEEGTFYADV